MRNAVDIARAQREAAVCRLLEQQGHVAPTVHDVVTVGDRPGLVMDRIEGEDLLAALQRRPLRVLTAARVLAEVHG
jgi:aminoglycoside phosphotransferase (APT) family kinase protein